MSENNTEVFRFTSINITDCKGEIIKTVNIHQDSYKTIIVNVNGVEFKMIYVKGGILKSGSTYHLDMKIDDFYIGETEVTEDLYSAVMESVANGSQSASTNRSLDEYDTFISKLNTLSGYSFSRAGGASWLYAAKGGIYSKNYKYAGGNEQDLVASRTYGKIKTALPNELGIYDMSGNAAEYGYSKNEYLYELGGYTYSTIPPKEIATLDRYLEAYINNQGLDSYSYTFRNKGKNGWGIRLKLQE